MSLPFTLDQFLATFRAYNGAIGAAPLLLITLAIAAVVLAYSTLKWRHHAIAAILALLWAWSGLVYHEAFFSRINPAAHAFGALFLVQAIILLTAGLRGELTFTPRERRWAPAGWLLIVYAIVVYPLLGAAQGHGYPNGPSFGAPCPVLLYYFGMLTWSASRSSLAMRLALYSIPAAWAIIGTGAAVQLGIREDFALIAAAIVALAASWRLTVAKSPAAVPSTFGVAAQPHPKTPSLRRTRH